MKKFSIIIVFFLALAVVLLLPKSASASVINVNSIVYGPPPSTPPTITYPVNGQDFGGSLLGDRTINIQGSCIAGLQVRVFTNSIFGGSTICGGGNAFSLQMNLLIGNNTLVARQYDGLDQPSPDSSVVTVYYYPAVPPAILAKTPLLTLNCDYSINRAFADKPFSLPCQISGGVAPYAISIDWGDGTTGVVARETQGNFTLEHIYKGAGNYIIKLKASDKTNSSSYLQLAVTVSGKQDILNKITEPLYQCKPDIIWPIAALIGGAALILISSYGIGILIGERKELEELRRLHRLKPPQK